MASLTPAGTAGICFQASFSSGGLGVVVGAGRITVEVTVSVVVTIVGWGGSGVLVIWMILLCSAEQAAKKIDAAMRRLDLSFIVLSMRGARVVLWAALIKRSVLVMDIHDSPNGSPVI
jgi:hypothetical protein